jgi:hypothetical protein
MAAAIAVDANQLTLERPDRWEGSGGGSLGPDREAAPLAWPALRSGTALR